MSTLRLGLHKLPAAEVVLIQTLLRLNVTRETTTRWALVDHPPYDAVLVDTTTNGSLGAEAARMAADVLCITRMNEASQPNSIERPIRPDKLFNWLNKRQANKAAALQGTASVLAAPSSVPDAGADVRHRLLRWPPAIILRNDRQRIRLATLLSKRAFSAVELSLISGQTADDCLSFLRLLRSTGFVEPVVEPPAAQAAPASEAAPQRERGFAKGLISGLRRRLGL